MKTVHAIYENGVFRPTEPVSLPENSEVELQLHETAHTQPNREHGPRVVSETDSIEDKLISLARQVPEEDWQLLPTDLTDNLDHYLYGTPKDP